MSARRSPRYPPPRIRYAPRHAGDWGDRVVALADRCGLHLDDWQADVLRDALSVDASGHWKATRVGVAVPRQNGKGAIIEALELAHLLGLFPEQRLLLHTAHQYRTSQDAFRRTLAYFDTVPALEHALASGRAKIGTASAREFITVDGRTIRYLARSKSSGRGFSADMLILDESQDLTDDEWAAILPTTSARPNPQIWLLGTPPDEDITPGTVVKRLRASALDRTDKRFAWVEWSRAPEDDPADPDVWARTNPALGTRIRLEAIRDEFASMSLATFDRERLGSWDNPLGETFAVIPEDAWTALRSDSVVRGRVAFAVDVAPDRRRATIASAGFVEGDRIMVQVVDSRTGVGWVPARMRELTARWSYSMVALDSGGPAASLLPELRRMRVHRVRPMGTSDIKAACGLFYDLAVGTEGVPARLAHPGQPGLDEAVAGARKRPLGDAWAWHRRDSQVDITPLVAVTLAAYGLISRAPRSQAGLDEQTPPRRRAMIL